MIKFFRTTRCDSCDRVQETLRELVVAHEVIDVAQADSAEFPAALAKADLPAIQDGDRLVVGTDALNSYLTELTHEVERWRLYQADACYIGDDGKVC